MSVNALESVITNALRRQNFLVSYLREQLVALARKRHLEIAQLPGSHVAIEHLWIDSDLFVFVFRQPQQNPEELSGQFGRVGRV